MSLASTPASSTSPSSSTMAAAPDAPPAAAPRPAPPGMLCRVGERSKRQGVSDELDKTRRGQQQQGRD